MRLAVDATPLLGPLSGVGSFTVGAVDALARRPDVELFGYAMSWRGRTLLREVLPQGVTSGWAVPAGLLLRLWKRSDLVPVEWLVDVDDGVDVVHGTNFVVPPARRSARVVTVHDLTCVRFPEMCTRTTLRYPGLIRRAVASGAWVHTPSAYVAAEVCEAFGADPSRVRAVHHGLGRPDDGLWAGLAAGGAGTGGGPAGRLGVGAAASAAAASAAAGRCRAAALTGSERYVLALGTVEPRKDLPLLVRAFDRVADDHPDLGLVIAGASGWGADRLERAIADARHGARIGRPGYVDGADRLSLLAGAAVFALPSVYEGFGLPPLESMAAGVPVVATAAGAVPEVCGDAAVLVPVGDEEAFAAALADVLDDEARAARLVAAGRVRAQGYTWDRCAEGLVSIYRDAVDAA